MHLEVSASCSILSEAIWLKIDTTEQTCLLNILPQFGLNRVENLGVTSRFLFPGRTIIRVVLFVNSFLSAPISLKINTLTEAYVLTIMSHFGPASYVTVEVTTIFLFFSGGMLDVSACSSRSGGSIWLKICTVVPRTTFLFIVFLLDAYDQ